eukprot:1378563-Rhodomonas_salina.1
MLCVRADICGVCDALGLKGCTGRLSQTEDSWPVHNSCTRQECTALRNSTETHQAGAMKPL